jgi:hypothetical protein
MAGRSTRFINPPRSERTGRHLSKSWPTGSINQKLEHAMMTLVLFPSSTQTPDADLNAEDRIARLTDAAYRVALQKGISGSFVDVQLGIWSAIRNVIEVEASFSEDEVQDRFQHRPLPARNAGKG